jgi:Ca2+-binding EF-hand superfamily protein
MGCCLPKSLQLSERQRDEVLAKYRRVRGVLGLTEDELWGLYCAFVDCNRDESGMVKEDELFSFLDMDGGPFSQRTFKMFQDVGEGISFKNFVVAAWSICTRDKNSLAHFAFQLYDIQGRGELGLADVRLLLAELFGPSFEEKPAPKEIMDKLVRRDHTGKALEAHVDVKAFSQIVLIRPLLLFPAFELQNKLQEKTLGTSRWETVTTRRDEQVSNGTFDITRVVLLANEGRPRRASVLPVSDRHVMGLTAAAGPMLRATPIGMKRGTKVKAEDDYYDLSPEMVERDATILERVTEAVQYAVDNPRDAAIEVASTAVAVAQTAGRRASVALVGGVQNALAAGGFIDGPTVSAPPQETDAEYEERVKRKAARRASQAAREMGIEGMAAAGHMAAEDKRKGGAASGKLTQARQRRASAVNNGDGDGDGEEGEGGKGGRRASASAPLYDAEEYAPVQKRRNSVAVYQPNARRASVTVRGLPEEEDGVLSVQGTDLGSSAAARRGSVAGAGKKRSGGAADRRASAVAVLEDEQLPGTVAPPTMDIDEDGASPVRRVVLGERAAGGGGGEGVPGGPSVSTTTTSTALKLGGAAMPRFKVEKAARGSELDEEQPVDVDSAPEAPRGRGRDEEEAAEAAEAEAESRREAAEAKAAAREKKAGRRASAAKLKAEAEKKAATDAFTKAMRRASAANG